MIPRCDEPVDVAIPTTYQFWTPRSEDISEEGFAYFRDTWMIRRVGIRLARSVMTTERELVAVADACSTNGEEFDEIATALETSDLDEIPGAVRESAAFDTIACYYSPGDRMSLVEALDLGVAGIVYALSAVGCWPAASCRGHVPGGWAQYPVVYIAADRHRTETLQPLVAAAGCGFDVDPARGQLLVIRAASVTEMMDLAELVLVAKKTFIPRRGPRRPKRRDAGEQLALDLPLAPTGAPESTAPTHRHNDPTWQVALVSPRPTPASAWSG